MLFITLNNYFISLFFLNRAKKRLNYVKLNLNKKIVKATIIL